MAGVSVVDRITNSQVYKVVYQDPLPCLGDRRNKATRVPAAAVAALETMVVDVSAHSLLLPSLCLVVAGSELGHSAYQRKCQAEDKVQPTGFSARTTGPKTLGAGRSFVCGTMVIGSSSVQHG